MFEWIERIQSYSGWDYFDNLQRFADGGMTDDAFIDTVSSIFTRGCHEPECSESEVTQKEKRRENFKKVLAVFGLPKLTPQPTVPPTPSPTTLAPTTASPVKKIQAPSLSQRPPPQPTETPTKQPTPAPVKMTEQPTSASPTAAPKMEAPPEVSASSAVRCLRRIAAITASMCVLYL